MNDITPKEAIEILSHYTDLGYGIVIEGEDTSKIKQALSLASKTLANGAPYNPSGDCISRESVRSEIWKERVEKDEGCNSEYIRGLKTAIGFIDNAQAVNTDVVADNVITAHENIGYEKGFNDGYAKCVTDNERSQGDCISREALKEAVSKVVAEERKEDEKWATGLRYALKLIDNAQAVEDRPQGEWCYGEDECGQDGWFCSECGFFVPWYYTYHENDINFIRDYKACPHCLAEMITYTGKDRDTEGGTE